MGNSFTTIVMIALMVVAFYFLLIRPQKKRQQAQQRTMNELQPGTRVLLGSGLFGTLTWVGAKQATMETSPGVEVTVLKQAIARIVTPGDEYAEPGEVDEPDAELDQAPADRPDQRRTHDSGPDEPTPTDPVLDDRAPKSQDTTPTKDQ
jgi:preprotein translocase subunit YajC